MDKELIDMIRRDLGLSKIEFSDDDIWEKLEDTFLAQALPLGISIDVFKKVYVILFRG
jgi:hypothetical protein